MCNNKMSCVTLCLLVTFSVLPSLDAATSHRNSDAVKYPGPVQQTDNHEDDDVPEACKGLTYCTIPPKNYPYEKFNKMFKGYKGRPQPSLVTKIVINDRQGDHSEDDDCATKVTFEPLYKVREKRGDNIEKWRTVVQAPDHDYVQKVRLETCMDVEKPCFETILPPLSLYTTYCKQTFNTWEVLVSKGDETEVIKSVLPVCCSCHYKQTEMSPKH